MKFLVAGCGRIGSSLARALLDQQHEVCLIDPDPGQFALLETQAVETVTGSPLDREVLVQAGIERADGVALVFSLEATNLAVALDLRRHFRVPLVVARLHTPHLVELAQRLGIQPLSPLELGVRRLTEVLCASPLKAVASLGDQFDLLEVHLGTVYSVEELTVAGEIGVVSLTRAGRTTLAHPGLRLRVGDLLHMAVRRDSRARLRGLLAGRKAPQLTPE